MEVSSAMARKVLIADSENWAIDTLRSALQELGHEVAVATNGVEALELFKSVAPHLVIVDHLLAKIDGLHVASKIRATEAGRVVPVILVSPIYQRDADLDELRERHGFSDLLEKPFSPKEAREVIQAFLSDEPEVSSADEEPLDLEGQGDQLEEKLNGHKVTDIVLDLFRRRQTGILTVRSGEVTKVVFFDRGSVTHARSNSNLDRLGRILLRSRRISDEQYELAQVLQLKSGGRLKLGTALVELGCLGENDVREAVLAQATNILLSLFAWREGSWSFESLRHLPSDFQRFSINTPDIVFWGLRRLEGVDDFRGRLPSLRYVLERVPGGERVREQLGLTSFEEQVLAMADGRRRISEILSIGELGEIDVARVVYSYLALGILIARPEGGDEAFAPVEPELTIPARGTLDELSVVELVARLWRSGASGRLHLLRDQEWRQLHFERGSVVWASSSLMRHRIGEILLKAGKVTSSDHAQALELQSKNSDRKLGSLLLDLRSLSLEELDWALRFQVQRVFLDILAWDEAIFAFEARTVNGEEFITLQASTPDLILEGTRRRRAPKAARQLVSSPDVLLVKAWDGVRIARHLKLGRNELRLLDALECGRTAQEVLRLEIMNEEELARALSGFLALEVVRAIKGDVAESRSSVAELEETEGAPRRTSVTDAQPAGAAESEAAPAAEMAANPDGTVMFDPEGAALRAENARLRERVASLEAALRRLADLSSAVYRPPAPALGPSEEKVN